jgi:hypothetical protein
VGKYRYYVILGFIPVYEYRLGMTISPSAFRNQPKDEAKKYYESIEAKLPVTRKIFDFDNRTALYFLKYGITDLVMMIRAKRFVDAVKAFDVLRCLLALAYHTYSEEADIVPLAHKPNFTRLSIQDLATLIGFSDTTLASVEIQSGIQVSDIEILNIKEKLRKAFLHSDIRRALACFYQGQTIYYTHLVSSFVSVHSRPELIGVSREEYKQNNFRYQEKLHASLLICYRGIEAIYSKNFRAEDFKKANRGKLESYMDAKIPNAPSRSRYLLRFYRQREARPPKYRLVINMLEVFFRARNRAAHGYHWERKHRFETFGSDLVDESKFFLGHLIAGALD